MSSGSIDYSWLCDRPVISWNVAVMLSLEAVSCLKTSSSKFEQVFRCLGLSHVGHCIVVSGVWVSVTRSSLMSRQCRLAVMSPRLFYQEQGPVIQDQDLAVQDQDNFCSPRESRPSVFLSWSCWLVSWPCVGDDVLTLVSVLRSDVLALSWVLWLCDSSNMKS